MNQLLEASVIERFGVLPNFFRLASADPNITRNLWGFAQFAYLDNPLPASTCRAFARFAIASRGMWDFW